MTNNDPDKPQPQLVQVEPVLPVKSITETITYWHEVLCFPNKWTWGDPPNHGGVTWHGVHVQFSLNPETAASQHNYTWIHVKHIDTLHELHKEKGAEIVSPFENKPWGMTEYVVREINGHYVCFSGHTAAREKSGSILSPSVRIIARKPTVAEYNQLKISVGWTDASGDPMAEAILAPIVFAVVAEDSATNETIGCALLLGDNASFYYVKDVMVRRDWQAKQVGTAMMKELIRWLKANAPNNAMVSLITGENLATFYRQFNFSPAFAMITHINRSTP
jgi:GNAT superfamily N-acetyltransferase